MITLYEFAVSGNCHKIRLLLSLLNVNYKSIQVNGTAKEHKSEAFLKLNPFGQVPVLTDGDITIRDSQAILVYLTRQYGDEHWLPLDAIKLATVNAWLSVAANEVLNGPALLRVHYKFGRIINTEEVLRNTANLLNILDARLSKHPWLAGDHITIADIAVYPYIALAPEAKIDLEPYSALINWLRKIQGLPGYVGMSGMF